MSVSRITLWRFDDPNKDAKLINDELDATNLLDSFTQGSLHELIKQKIINYLGAHYANNKKEYNRVYHSFSIYVCRNEFFIYEFVKNSYEAGAKYLDLFINAHPCKDKVVTTLVDNGKGLAEFFKKDDRHLFQDRDGALPFISLISPNFIPHHPESERNHFTIAKFRSDKYQEGQEGKQINRAMGLSQTARLAYKTHSQFIIIDVADFRKSTKYPQLTGITNFTNFPKTGTMLIFISDKFKKSKLTAFEEENKKDVDTPETLANRYVLDMSSIERRASLYLETTQDSGLDDLPLSDKKLETPLTTPETASSTVSAEPSLTPLTPIVTDEETPFPRALTLGDFENFEKKAKNPHRFHVKKQIQVFQKLIQESASASHRYKGK